MKIKKIKKIVINSVEFAIKWDKSGTGGSFSYHDYTIIIGCHKELPQCDVFNTICHELMELVAIAMGVRLHRPDVDSDYIFVYDHRQHHTMAAMFSGLVSQFIV